MQALQFDHTGTLDALQLRDVPEPTLTANDVLIEVHAAGVNPSDLKNVLGRFPYTTVPRIPGRDFAGVVVRGPTAWQGKAVWGSGKGIGFTRDGSHAEHIAFPVAGLSLKPDALSFVQAASCGVPYITALEAIERTGVTKNTRVLLIGAAGAVGSAALALANMHGANVLAAVRNPQQAEALRASGVSVILLQDAAQLAAEVQQHFAGGADVIFDTTGFWLAAAVAALANHGRISVIAAPADGHAAAFPQLDFYRRGAQIVGVNSLLHELPACAQMLDRLGVLFNSGTLAAPRNLHTAPLEDGIRVYREMEQGSSHKTVLLMKN